MNSYILRIYLVIYYCNVFIAGYSDGINVPQVVFLEPGTIVDYHPKTRHKGFFDNDMRIYCYGGSRKDWTHIFENIELQLEIEKDEFKQYEGATPSEVRQNFEDRQSLFSFNLFSNKRTRLNLYPFKQQCIGIDTTLPYRVRLHQLRFDYFRIIQFSVGICLFIFAGSLSNNSILFYLTGVTIGIGSSFMLIIWLTSKLMPRRPMVYTVLIGGWSIGFYIIQRLWDNLHLIFQMYRAYVLCYIFTTGIISFFFCYRIGPPTNQRSKNIIKWVLQIMAIIMAYFSIQYEEASVLILAAVIFFSYLPSSLLYKPLKIYRWLFPPKRRLLTNEEFYEEGIRETSKALNELRAYASSPDCKQWKIISKLSDPLRFAAFVEGQSHLREEEILRYENHTETIEHSETDSDENFEMEKKYKKNNLPRSYFKNEQYGWNQSKIFSNNTTYDETSEEGENDEDDIVYEDTANSKGSFNNMNNQNKSNYERSGTHKFYDSNIDRTFSSKFSSNTKRETKPKM
ncbi:nuclear envelope integral membrane protein 1a [Bactrocera dorsalis]|uniref:Nuclear envelope integral membrane protein 1a n=1 Tax=Bactrocera dorsalis TaxID=27457 RepID=A0A6I9V921_BACDO|nr:nuclear envelope integral membrane protein 1a [Bactrocera dorsalis]